MTQSATQPVIFESHADLLAAVPVTFLMKSGTLRLADGRLSFTRSRNRVVFDAPMSEIHSVATNAFGITVWHGPKRYRFAIGHKSRVGVHSDNALIAAASLPGAISDYREARQGAGDWAATLRPLAGAVPSGVAVSAPWPMWKMMSVILGGIVGIVAVITVIAVALN